MTRLRSDALGNFFLSNVPTELWRNHSMENNWNRVGVTHNFPSINILRVLFCMGVARRDRKEKSNYGNRNDFEGCLSFHVSKVHSSSQVGSH